MAELHQATAPKKNPIFAGLLSLVLPGLGQIYSGQWRRGLTLLVGLPVQIALFYGVGLNWLIYWMALVWVWNVFDAAMTARRQGQVTSALIPIILILALNMVAAYKVTDIHLPQLQAEQRGVIGQIVGGMTKPDFFTRKETTQTANTRYIVPAPGKQLSSKQQLSSEKPSISISPLIAVKGTRMTVEGSGFAPDAKISLVLLSSEETQIGNYKVDKHGKFSASFQNTRDIPGTYYIQARAQLPGHGFVMSEALRTAAPRMLETIYLALIGTTISLIFAIPLSFLGARNLMSGSPFLKAIYGITRGIFSLLRSVEVLIIAVIAVAAVGIGPFAGVLALAIHGIGAMGKLYSEAIESIEHGPIEAIRSTGANEFQVVLYGVVPQVVPQFIAFTLYRWDINVRMATVIGLVGGGGIGYLLVQYMNLLQWPQAATAIWMIAGVVMLMDYASAIIREKVI